MAVSLLLADDHAFTLSGLQRTFTDDPAFDVVATAARGAEAVALARRFQPDIALIDYVLPDTNGRELMVEIRRWSPETRVAVLTGTAEPGALRGLVDGGALGILSKGDDPEAVRSALLQIMRGVRVISPTIAGRLELMGDAPTLSHREQQVLDCIALGMSNKAIGEELGISLKTVDSHRTNLMRKLEANSTASLLMNALQHRLISH